MSARTIRDEWRAANAAPDPVPEPKVPAILDHAAALIDRGGLARHRYAGADGSYSAEGAIQRAFGDLGGSNVLHGDRNVRLAVKIVRKRVGRPLSKWSDDPKVDADRVVEVLRLAARDAETRLRNPHEW